MRFITSNPTLSTFYIATLIILDILLCAKIAFSYNHNSQVKKNVSTTAISSTPSQTLGYAVIPSNIPTTHMILPSSTPIQSPTSIPIPTNTPTPQPQNNTPSPQISQSQAALFTPSTNVNDAFEALNSYRQKKGVPPLSWDQTLGNFAKSRADYFAQSGGMDSHAGFQSMMNDNGFEKMGFNSLGENSSFGDYGSPTNLIEGIYAGDAPHDQNQLNSEWTHVGVGISANATDFVFGGRKR